MIRRFARVALPLALGVALAGCPYILGVDGSYTERNGGTDGSVSVDGRALDTDGAVVIDDAGATDDGRARRDAGGDASGPPLPSTPNAVAPCGAPDSGLSCSGTNSQCCFTGTSASCVASVQACTGIRASQLFCDEPADCSAQNQHCCVDLMAGGRFRTSCASGGSGCVVRACRSDADCVAANCVAWDCPNGPLFATCGGVGFDPSRCF